MVMKLLGGGGGVGMATVQLSLRWQLVNLKLTPSRAHLKPSSHFLRKEKGENIILSVLEHILIVCHKKLRK